MKKIVKDKELVEKMEEAIHLLCDTVKTTLGPKGLNTIIDCSDMSPFITNDGVTIAANISSEDKVVDVILELAKEASIKTNEVVGDGTTTTLVLLENLYLKGRDILNEGYNPIILKKELDRELENIISKIKNYSHQASFNDLKNIAINASGSKSIGSMLTNAARQVGIDGIILREGKDETTSTYLQGYFFETIIASPFFFQNQEKIELNHVLLLLTEKTLDSLEEIDIILNDLVQNKKSLLVIAKDFTDNFVNNILDINMNYELKIILLKYPGYGKESYNILKDLEVITEAKIVLEQQNISFSDLGTINRIEITKEFTQINFEKSEKLKDYIASLQNKTIDEYEKISYQKRISMLEKGIVKINVGAITSTERKEKMMRYEDALCALKSSLDGVLPGSGLIFYRVSDELDSKNIGSRLLKDTLKIPLFQILQNAGIDEKTTIANIVQSDFTKIYNVKINTYEDISSTSVIDSLNVLISSLQNAVSIASMLLTTSSLVINEQEYKNKTDFNL